MNTVQVLFGFGFLAKLALACVVSDDTDPGPVFGLSLGTANSYAIFENDARISVPMVVSYDLRGTALVGASALSQSESNPTNTIYDIMRLAELPSTNYSARWPFKVIEQNNARVVEVQTLEGTPRAVPPEAMLGLILLEFVKEARQLTGEQVENIVVAVPSPSYDQQRRLVKTAAEMAELSVLRVCSQVTAALMGCGLTNNDPAEQLMVLVDVGASQLGVALVALDSGVFELISTTSNDKLGGSSYDEVLVLEMLRLFEKDHGVNASQNTLAVRKIRTEAERAKRALSNENNLVVKIEHLTNGLDLTAPLTRKRFEDLSQVLFQNTLEEIRGVLAENQVQIEQLSAAVLVGGGSRIPELARRISDLFGADKMHRCAVDPEYAAAQGALNFARMLREPPTYFPSLPISDTNIGVEIQGGVFESIVPRHVFLPTKRSRVFSTSQHESGAIEIRIFEGLRALARDNEYLTSLNLVGVKAAKGEVVEIQVTMEIDVDGYLHISAQCGDVTAIATIRERSHTNWEEMLRDYENNADMDEVLRDQIKALNRLKRYIRFGHDFVHSQELESEVDSVVREVREWAKVHGAQATTSELESKLAALQASLAVADPAEISWIEHDEL
eukprot:c16717_g1_i1.p1 GENE.c16717_g1_i1~~c16717_g1_i1.p1  ORF type:complete len:616 (-),score=144.37 c16717_g1_i1:8-1855(-)